MARKTPVSTACDENEDTVHKITPSMKKKRITLELSDNEDDEIREIHRNTSIADVSDSHDNLETTISELAVHSSSKKRHKILSSDSDSEDNEKKSYGRTPRFNELKKSDAHATKVKRNLFRKNEEEGEWNKVTSERDSEGDGDSISMREIGGTSDNSNGAALISSSQKRRSTRSNSTCQNNGTVASAEKLKKSKALEELTRRRSSRKGACSRLSSNLADDDDNKSSLHKLEEDQVEEEDQKEREEDENDLGSDSDLSDFIDVDSSQSQKLDDISFKKLTQEQCFEAYLQMILSGIVNDEFLSSLEKDKVPYFEEAKATIQGLIQTKKNAMMGKWKEFKEMLEDCTLIKSIPLPEIIKNAKCEACNLKRHLSEIIVFYDEENGEKVTPPVKEFKVGRFCAERGHIYHELHHLDFEWKEKCIEKINQVKAANPEVEGDAEIVEHCMSDEEWLEDLYGRFQSLFGVADDYGPGGRKRLAMEQYCSGFCED